MAGSSAQPAQAVRAKATAAIGPGRRGGAGANWICWSDELQQHIGSLIAYDSAGQELWQTDTSPQMRENDIPSRVAIGPDGFIYVQGWGLKCFDPEGHRRWGDSSPEHRTTTTITLGDGALFSASYGVGGGSNPDGHPSTDGRLHRLDPVPGRSSVGDRALWKHAALPRIDDRARGQHHRRRGQRDRFESKRRPRVRLRRRGRRHPIPCLAGEDVLEYTWLEATPSGDLVVAMKDYDEPAQIRRLSLEGEVRWTLTAPPGPGTVNDLVLGPDQWIAVAARLGDPFNGRGSLQIYTDAGEPAWNVEFPPEHDGERTVAAVAFGPGFLVIAGSEPANDGMTTWIRKIGQENAP